MFCSSEFPAAVFQQVEELFCVVAVVDGVVEFGSDRDFYPAVNLMIFSNHDEGDVTDGRGVVVGERIWFGVTQCRISGVGHNGNMYVVQVVFLWIVQSFAGFPKALSSRNCLWNAAKSSL